MAKENSKTNLSTSGNDARAVTVTAKLAVPTQRFTPGNAERVIDEIPLKVEDQANPDALERMRAEAAKLIEGITGKQPRWLSASRTFIVTALPEQISEIASSPLIKEVLPSERLMKCSA